MGFDPLGKKLLSFVSLLLVGIMTIGASELILQSDAPDNDSMASGIEKSSLEATSGSVDARPYLESILYYADIQKSALEKDAMQKDTMQKDAMLKDTMQNAATPSYADVLGTILPHHTVAHEMICDFFAKASKKNTYDLIVVISPNHASLGKQFQVSLKNYLTYNGQVMTDRHIAGALINSKLAVEVSDDVLTKEHGQLVHMNYIGYYFEKTPVLSIMINETRSYEGIREFSEVILNSVKDKKVLYIASIDFSHYLTLDQADKNDAMTEVLLEQNNPERMISLSNDYIDSPSCYALLIELLKKSGTYTTMEVEHNNSAVILNKKNIAQTTSYFSFIYTEYKEK